MPNPRVRSKGSMRIWETISAVVRLTTCRVLWFPVPSAGSENRFQDKSIYSPPRGNTLKPRTSSKSDTGEFPSAIPSPAFGYPPCTPDSIDSNPRSRRNEANRFTPRSAASAVAGTFREEARAVLSLTGPWYRSSKFRGT